MVPNCSCLFCEVNVNPLKSVKEADILQSSYSTSSIAVDQILARHQSPILSTARFKLCIETYRLSQKTGGFRPNTSKQLFIWSLACFGEALGDSCDEDTSPCSESMFLCNWVTGISSCGVVLWNNARRKQKSSSNSLKKPPTPHLYLRDSIKITKMIKESLMVWKHCVWIHELIQSVRSMTGEVSLHCQSSTSLKVCRHLIKHSIFSEQWATSSHPARGLYLAAWWP